MLKLLKKLSKKDVLLIILCILCIVFQVWLDLKLPDYMSNITVLVKTSGSKLNDILKEGLYMALCAFASLGSSIFVGYLTSLISSNFSRDIRALIFNKVQSFSLEEIKKFSCSSLITRTTNDVTHVQMFLAMGLQMIIKAPITAVWAIRKILKKNWQWSMVTAGAVLILITTVAILIIFVLPKFKRIQKLIDKLNGLVRENLTGIKVVKAFNAEEYEQRKFEKANNNLTNIQLYTQKMMGIMSPVMYLIMNLLTLAIYYVGAILINDAVGMDKITLFGNMVVFSSYAMQVIMSFLMLALIFVILPRTSVSAKRINEVLNTKNKIKEGTNDGSDIKLKATLEFIDVSFKYPDSDEYVLQNISFTLEKGQTLSIIGSTGCGKSTLVNLIMRFYDPTSGEILLDGVNIKEYKFKELYNKLGYASQKAVMFNGTVNYNVSYGSSNVDVNDEVIKKACEVAKASNFVLKMKQGYKSVISQGGINISGGQKQRLSIARAIARKPEVYIFDDTFSALDYKTDYSIRKDLKEYAKDSSRIIVAQRIGTIIDSDIIIVLEQGKCVGMGKHKELLKICDIYREIALSQAKEEELLNA